MVYFFHKMCVYRYTQENNNQHMSSILLYHHLGLGDHFMCHGIVREYAKKYTRVALFSKPQNYASVSFMFRDLENIRIINVKNDEAAYKFIFLNKFKIGKYKYNEVKIIGHEFLDKTSGVPIELQFYKLAGINLTKKWGSFFIERDTTREKALLARTSLVGEYAFIHDDPSRNFIIDRKYVNQSCTFFTPNKNLTNNIFDYCSLIENASEIHVIDSSFMFLIDCLPYSNPNQKLFVHRYSRENPKWQLPILKKNWDIVTK